MLPYKRHLISKDELIKSALRKLDELALDSILFVIDDSGRLVGSLTDGDVRRGFLKGLGFDSQVADFIHKSPKYVVKGRYDLNEIVSFKRENFRIIPVVDSEKRIVNVINFRFLKSYLPLDAVIMAGGRGERLKPLTESVPKPLLHVGGKPIIEHNIDRLISFGVDDFWLTLRYLGEQIESYFSTGSSKNVNISYVWEEEALGTIGAVSLIDTFKHDDVLVTNSDILTDLDYEDFFRSYRDSKADFSVVTIPYQIKVPYAVLETSNGHVLSLKEKPTYTYYSNGGIYLIKKEILQHIPVRQFFNATDLMERLIAAGHKVHSYPLHGYWLDVGTPEDYKRAQEDIRHIKLQ